MRVLGIDPSTTATGLAQPDGSCATIRPRAKTPSARRHEQYLYLLSYLQHHCIEVAIIEAVMPSSREITTTIKLAQLSGVLQVALFHRAVDVVEVWPNTLKKYLTGNGNAKKPEMLAAAKAEGGRCANDNEADAFGLALIGAEHYAGKALSKHRAAISAKLAWPN